MKRTFVGWAAIGFLMVSGCGPKFTKVEGTITYEDDGSPVSGATVVFMGEGQGDSASGMTDEQGKYSLQTGNKSGAKNGKYAVVITKRAARTGGGSDMSEAEKMKMMKQDADPNKKSGAGGGAVMMPGKGPGQMGAPPGANKSELGDEYASAERTPFKGVVVPGGEYNYKVKRASKKK